MFIVIRRADNSLRLFGPPPGPAHDDSGRRRWQALLDGKAVSQEEVDDFVERQCSFDPDIWVIDIDDPTGYGLLDVETIEF